jgi:hypothetical protein
MTKEALARNVAALFSSLSLSTNHENVLHALGCHEHVKNHYILHYYCPTISFSLFVQLHASTIYMSMEPPLVLIMLPVKFLSFMAYK